MVLRIWRVADGGACAWFRTGSFAEGVSFVQAINESDEVDTRPPDVDLRAHGVAVRVFTTSPSPDGLSVGDVVMARRISLVARALGLKTDPAAVHNVVINTGRSISRPCFRSGARSLATPTVTMVRSTC
ncbi:4a-hydroxytetrahydrobiopterin dehydratase [Kribbella sp. NBC_00709]|uniref:4a-hydroxytetrahydrobiopterin dehydratase n=1 Tax=Kribbella sp. NBC_00709 TaxID=2975972 RepID=UPI003FA5A93E